MLIISNHELAGINSLFPALIRGRGEVITALDWKFYKRFLPAFVLINLLFTLCFFFLLFDQFAANSASDIFTAANVSLFVYSVARVRFGRRIVRITQISRATTVVAPPLVWLDYVTTGMMFVLMAGVALREETDQFWRLFIVAFQVLFFAYAILPLLNYVHYRLANRRL